MAPIQSNSTITIHVCNRTRQAWNWEETKWRESDLINEKEKFRSTSISAKGRTIVQCQTNSDNQILAVLHSSPQSSSKKGLTNSPVEVEIRLKTTAVSSSNGCFGRKKGKSFKSGWIGYDFEQTKCENNDRIKILYRQTSIKHFDFLIISSVNPTSFLSTLPDQANLSSLCIPGTHESLARYGWPISTCQSSESTVSKQLQDGIRYLDVRLVPKGDRLLAYHGITDERIEFGAVLQQCWNFLETCTSETIIMSIKQESGDQDTFIKTLFETYVNQSPANPANGKKGSDRWFLENRVPNLGEVRGKIVMLSRFVIASSYGYQGGISPPIWPNSFKGIFNYTLPSGQSVITQDWYDIGSLSQIEEKFSLIEELSTTSIQSSLQNQTFALNYTNGSSFPFALPPAVAKGFLDSNGNSTCGLAVEGVNCRVRDFVADIHFDSEQINKSGALPGLQVTWAMDYYDEPQGAQDLVPLLIAANF